jgi:NAD(P)H-dependent flavin oxidoreductase YrpB (nitropropane dioxygenase family)
VTSPLHTPACDLFGVEYPIIQTGMGWVSGAELTAATSAAGGLGILAAATLTYDELEAAIHDIQEATDRPFGVNLRADQEDIGERLDLLIREKIRVASFAMAPGKALIHKLKDAGVVTMPTIGARRHAEKVAEWGADAVIAQGGEGGGHTGSIPTSILVPQVCDAVDIPVIAAGGYRDGRGLVSAMAYGAAGIAMGTRFLLTRESSPPESIKQIYLATGVKGTVVTRSIDGYPQRVIRTELVQRLEKSSTVKRLFWALRYAFAFRKLSGTSFGALLREGLAMKKSRELSWSQMAMAANAPMMTRASMVDGRADVGILPTGQIVGLIDKLPTSAEVVEAVVKEALETLQRLEGTTSEVRSAGSAERAAIGD